MLESAMLKICKDYYSESLSLLTSIPSIGNKTAILLIALTDNFNKFWGFYYKKEREDEKLQMSWLQNDIDIVASLLYSTKYKLVNLQ